MRAIRNPNRESWLARRGTGIGASDACVILGLSKWKSPFSLYHEKLGVTPPPATESEAAEWGLLLEEPIAQKYARETGRKVTAIEPFLMYQHETCEWATATLDRWVEIDGVNVPLELKTAHASMAQEWHDEPPLAYQVQVQHQMYVTGAPRASLAALIGGQKFIWCDIERDDELIAGLIAKEEEFWHRLIDRNPPPVDSSAQTREMLKQLYQVETGEPVALGVEAIEWDDRLQIIKEQMKALEDEKRLYENRIIASIRNASVGTLPNDTAYTYKLEHRKEHLVKASEFRVLRRKGAKS